MRSLTRRRASVAGAAWVNVPRPSWTSLISHPRLDVESARCSSTAELGWTALHEGLHRLAVVLGREQTRQRMPDERGHGLEVIGAPPHRHPESVLDRTHRERRVRRDPSRERPRLGEELVGRHDARHEADAGRFGGVDGVAREQELGRGRRPTS